MQNMRREGDLVTITSRQDLIRALNEAVLAGESMAAGHGPRLGQQMLPALRITVVEVPEVCTQQPRMSHAGSVPWLEARPRRASSMAHGSRQPGEHVDLLFQELSATLAEVLLLMHKFPLISTQSSCNLQARS